MARKKAEILRDILVLLEEKKYPLNISEIATKINTNWKTTQINLDVLKKLGFVIEENKYYRLGRQLSKESDTFFNLPITEKDKNRIKTLYALIFNSWKKQSNKELTKTRMYKYAVKIIDEFNLELPTLWYKYGKIVLLSYNPSINYKENIIFDNRKGIIKRISNLISETYNYPLLKLKEELQYKFNKLYYNHSNFHKLLANTHFSKEDRDKLKDRLYGVLFSFKPHEYNQMEVELVRAFASYFVYLMKDDGKYLKSIKSNLIEIYDSIWNLIAISQAYESLINCEYPPSFLDLYIDLDDVRNFAEQSVYELKDLIRNLPVVQS